MMVQTCRCRNPSCSTAVGNSAACYLKFSVFLSLYLCFIPVGKHRFRTKWHHSGVLTWSLLGSKLTKLYLTISKVHNTAAKYRTDKGSPWNSTGMGIKSMSFLTVPWQAFARRGLSVPASDSQVFLGASCREQLDPWTDPSLAKTLLPPCRDWTCSPMWDCGLEMCSGAACIGILFSLNYIVSLCTFQ